MSITNARSERNETGCEESSISWIAAQTICKARNLHRPARRADFVSHLLRLRDEGVRVEHAIEAGIATLKAALLAEVLEVFAAGVRRAEIAGEPEVERMDNPLEAALLLVRSGLGIDRVLNPFTRLAFTEPEGRLMDALLLREVEGSLRMQTEDIQPYLSGAAPRPFRTWLASRPDGVLSEVLYFALTWSDYPMAEAALAVGASVEGWTPEMLQALRERPKHLATIQQRRKFEKEHGKGAAEALIELAVGTAGERGRMAARQRYPDIDRLLGLAPGPTPGAKERR